jgi:proteasome lid subunit RPN8/RPN11
MKRFVEDFLVYRERPLPLGALQGAFRVVEPVITETQVALQKFALAGIRDGGHEGMVFWAGRAIGDLTLFLQVIVPNAEHSRQRVHASKEAVAAAARIARQQGLGILCQVHSHPGSDTRHSDGDDELILLPFEGMLSIVVPNYGIGLRSIYQCGIHQFQSGSWVLCDASSVRQGIELIPTGVNLCESL